MLNGVDLLAIQYALTNEIARLEKGKENEYRGISDTVSCIIHNHKVALDKITELGR